MSDTRVPPSPEEIREAADKFAATMPQLKGRREMRGHEVPLSEYTHDALLLVEAARAYADLLETGGYRRAPVIDWCKTHDYQARAACYNSVDNWPKTCELERRLVVRLEEE